MNDIEQELIEVLNRLPAAIEKAVLDVLVLRHPGHANQKTHGNRFGAGQAKESLRRLKDDKGEREKYKARARQKTGMAAKPVREPGERTPKTVSDAQANLKRRQGQLDKVNEELRRHRDTAPFQGEIVGGEVQYNVVGQWRNSRRGQAWNRKEDELVGKMKALESKVFNAQRRLKTAKMGGIEIEKLDTFLGVARDLPRSLQGSQVLSSYKKAYSQALKRGLDVSNYPDPKKLAKEMGI